MLFILHHVPKQVASWTRKPKRRDFETQHHLQSTVCPGLHILPRWTGEENQVRRVVLTKTDKRVPRAIHLTWSGLYEWLGKDRTRSQWAERLRAYLRAAEVRLAREQYLTEGTLTMFDGFQFSADNPYTYGEGKRLLNLAMTELRKDKSLKALGMDFAAPGRGAITGRGGRAVWDFLSLADRPKRGAFTSYPHLTLAAHENHLEVSITIPNGVVSTVRRRLIDLGAEGLVKLNGQILRRARRILSRGGSIQAYAVQRHFVSQRSSGTIDARVDFKLETSHPAARRGSDPNPSGLSCLPNCSRAREQTFSLVTS